MVMKKNSALWFLHAEETTTGIPETISNGCRKVFLCWNESVRNRALLMMPPGKRSKSLPALTTGEGGDKSRQINGW
ncbi:hypothetical protein TNCT_232981 [Trichonephila clavata]|uniref:Uncharacterized protein n=1 Tax=Trichonephila clavata TaxID=2740835 RepID=A0A8X6K571_TRICU|nr:hypothetical protein TNCT_232981 [Trichonephila clavata]